MGALLLFMFVFASQVISGLNTKLPPPTYGNAITILNIDGGGIKGILPTVLLRNLEKALQVIDTLIHIKIELILIVFISNNCLKLNIFFICYWVH